MPAEVCGERTGRVWRYEPTRPLDAPGSGERFKASDTDDGSLACVHRCEKGTYWQDDVDRLRWALELACRPAIAAAEPIRQLIDHAEEGDTSGEFGRPGHLTAIWEWADITLDCFLREPDGDPVAVAAAVERNVRAALDVIHRDGFAHLDVAPNNILRVRGAWKLADLDSAVPLGEPAVRHSMRAFYVHPDHDGVAPAIEAFDHWGLERVVERLSKAAG